MPDMGHFWQIRDLYQLVGVLVLPALVLVYLGQGALVLADPARRRTIPFSSCFRTGCRCLRFLLDDGCDCGSRARPCCQAPSALVQQAIDQLGAAIPRLEVRSGPPRRRLGKCMFLKSTGYWPPSILALVFGFRSSDALANAYGIAVAGDMMVTTLLVTVVAYGLWQLACGPWSSLSLDSFFLLDLTFVLSQCSAKWHRRRFRFRLLVGAVALHSYARLAEKRPARGFRTAGPERHWSGQPPSSPVLINPARPSV